MPFRTALTAQTTAFDHGCGLHCLAHAYALNLKHGRFKPLAEEERTLKVLLEGFKAEYPAANTLTITQLKQILTSDLQNPLHREAVLSRVLRRLLPRADYRRKGVDVTEDLVLDLGARLGLKVESYSPLDVMITERLRNNGIVTPTSAQRKQVEREIRASGFYNIDKNGHVSLRGSFSAHPLPDKAPVLKLMNEYGGHWEWEYNLHDDEFRNLQEVTDHNNCYPRHKINYGKNDSAHVSMYGDELQARFNQALLNWPKLLASKKTLSSELSAFEDEVAIREKRVPAVRTNTAPSNMSSPLNIGSFFGDGFTKLFEPLFKAYMPAFTAPASKPPMNTAIPVVGNVLHALRDLFAPQSHYEPGFNDDKHTGHNGTKYKGSFFSLVSIGLDWLGNIFQFFGNLIGVAEQMQKNDPSRPLEEAELKTAEDLLFAEYLRFLPEQAAKAQKQLCANWRNPAIPKEKIFNDLKAALLEFNRGAQHDALLFKQHLAKLDPTAKRQLQIQYHRLQGGPLVWKSLAQHLMHKGLIKEASEILNREEYQVLNEGFEAPEDHPDPAPLEEAQSFYGQALDRFAKEIPTKKQYQTRLQMLEAIKRGGDDGEQILEDLKNISRNHYGAKAEHDFRSTDPRSGFAEGHGHAGPESYFEDEASAPDSNSPRHDGPIPSEPEGWTEMDWDSIFDNLNNSFKKSQQSGAGVQAKTENTNSEGFRPGFAAHAARHSSALPKKSGLPSHTPESAEPHDDARGRGRGKRRMGQRIRGMTSDGREVFAELLDD